MCASADSPPSDGGAGGAGAGGGVLLEAPEVILTGLLDAEGGGRSSENGGTIKIFTDNLDNQGTLNHGRLHQGPYPEP
jgi:hypothetical protein